MKAFYSIFLHCYKLALMKKSNEKNFQINKTIKFFFPLLKPCLYCISEDWYF